MPSLISNNLSTASGVSSLQGAYQASRPSTVLTARGPQAPQTLTSLDQLHFSGKTKPTDKTDKPNESAPPKPLWKRYLNSVWQPLVALAVGAAAGFAIGTLTTLGLAAVPAAVIGAIVLPLLILAVLALIKTKSASEASKNSDPAKVDPANAPPIEHDDKPRDFKTDLEAAATYFCYSADSTDYKTRVEAKTDHSDLKYAGLLREIMSGKHKTIQKSTFLNLARTLSDQYKAEAKKIEDKYQIQFSDSSRATIQDDTVSDKGNILTFVARDLMKLQYLHEHPDARKSKHHEGELPYTYDSPFSEKATQQNIIDTMLGYEIRIRTTSTEGYCCLRNDIWYKKVGDNPIYNLCRKDEGISSHELAQIGAFVRTHLDEMSGDNYWTNRSRWDKEVFEPWKIDKAPAVIAKLKAMTADEAKDVSFEELVDLPEEKIACNAEKLREYLNETANKTLFPEYLSDGTPKEEHLKRAYDRYDAKAETFFNPIAVNNMKQMKEWLTQHFNEFISKLAKVDDVAALTPEDFKKLVGIAEDQIADKDHKTYFYSNLIDAIDSYYFYTVPQRDPVIQAKIDALDDRKYTF